MFSELTIAYLFLGGVAAGSLLFLSLSQVARAIAAKRLERKGSWTNEAALCSNCASPETEKSFPTGARGAKQEIEANEADAYLSANRHATSSNRTRSNAWNRKRMAGNDARNDRRNLPDDATAPSSASTPNRLRSARSPLHAFTAIDGRFYSIAYTATGVVLGLGILCLAFDLPHPDRAILLFAYPTSSVLSIGSLILGFSLTYTVVFTANYWLGGFPLLARFRTSLGVVGVVAALAMALYPGVLLMTMPADYAWHSLLVPTLFTLSAFSTGIALLTICFALTPRVRGTARFIRRLVSLDCWLIVIKVVVTLGYLIVAVYLLQSWHLVEELLFGRGSMVFWLGYAVCGLAVPYVLEHLARTRPTDGLLLWLSALLLIGGYCLRVAVVGLQS